ncbi:MAG: PadR family transcriptional regulator [Candidatus Omnitrophica bacterium]|jgi:DNA-binding PadR family transcriptional regulator|nr:PadR family transcriptional regulator [Candidatus Omnitrophota bacterium]
MEMQRLIILGILKQGPRHGYEIKKVINKELGIFTSLENKSIYYPLEVMEKEGSIEKRAVKESGKLARYVYSITSRGNKEFIKLALKALLSEKRPFIDIDIPLYFLPYLERKEVLARVRLRKRFLEKVNDWLTINLKKKQGFSPHQRLLLKHHLNLLKTEENFLEDIIRMVKDN